MIISRIIDLQNGMFADIGENIEIDEQYYKILIAVDLNSNVSYDNPNINYIPAVLLCIEDKMNYNIAYRENFILGEILYE